MYVCVCVCVCVCVWFSHAYKLKYKLPDKFSFFLPKRTGIFLISPQKLHSMNASEALFWDASNEFR